VKRYLLDTSPLTAYLLGRHTAVNLMRPWFARREVTTTVLVQAEILEYFFGLAHFQRQRPALLRLLRAIHTTPLRFPTLEAYATIRRQMRPPHGPGLIDEIDTFTAATAIERDLSLVTTDSDFTRVPGLNVILIALTP
jgi:predicted nucleic acid-binding protein